MRSEGLKNDPPNGLWALETINRITPKLSPAALSLEEIMKEKKNDLQAIVQDYLQAFDQRDLDLCMKFFADDAKISFGLGVYRGKQDIEEWHKSRFTADLRVKHIDKIKAQSDAVTVTAVATSKVAKTWGFSSVAGTVTFGIQEGKINEVKFALRSDIPLENW